MSEPEGSFDVVLIGTGLTEAITAAALSKVGLKVAHLDPQPYYGGDQASLTLEELVSWAESKGFPVQIRDKAHVHTIPFSRQYSVSLLPSVIPATGPLISNLITSGVARYGAFKLLDKVFMCSSTGSLIDVPGSKEDIFNASFISLIDKRRLMKFLTFCMADGDIRERPEVQHNEDTPFLSFLESTFSLGLEVASAVAYALAFCSGPTDPTLPALRRIQDYLRSAGRYGPSPFLFGHYGSLGELAQGFCRTAAVNGAVYILGRSLTSLHSPSDPVTSKRKFQFTISDFEETMEADVVISSDPSLVSGFLDSQSLPRSQTDTRVPVVARCIAVIDGPLLLPGLGKSAAANTDGGAQASPESPPDTYILVFSPSSIQKGSTEIAATALITGSGSMSTPTGSAIVYISLPVPNGSETLSAESMLQPYLDYILSEVDPEGRQQPLLQVFFTDECSQSESEAQNLHPNVVFTPSLPKYPLPLPADEAATNAEKMFWEAIKVLEQREGGIATGNTVEFWPPLRDSEIDLDD